MSSLPPPPDKHDDDLEQTRAMRDNQTRGIPPVRRVTASTPPPPPGTSSHQPAPKRRPPPPGPAAVRRRGKARNRRDSGLYLPLWSLGLMLLVVIGVTVGLVLLVLGLGGNTPPESTPVVVISSPLPTVVERADSAIEQPGGTVPSTTGLSPATPTIPPELDPLSGGSAPPPVPPLRMSGPTLEVVVMTSTPIPLAVGAAVTVVDVGTNQLNVRDQPGVQGTSVNFRAEEGSEFTIVGGPQQADGLTWWQIEDPFNLTRTGWAASNYLQPAGGN